MKRTIEIKFKSIANYADALNLSWRDLAWELKVSEKTLRRLRHGGRTYRRIIEKIHLSTGIPRLELYADPNEIGHDEAKLKSIILGVKEANDQSNFGYAIELANEAIRTAEGFPEILYQAWEWWAISMDHAGKMEEAYFTLDQVIDEVPQNLPMAKFWLEYQAACIRLSAFEASCPFPGISRGSKSEQLLLEAEELLVQLSEAPVEGSEQLSVSHHLNLTRMFRGEPDAASFRRLFEKRTDYRRFYDMRRRAHALSLCGRNSEAMLALDEAQEHADTDRLKTLILRDKVWMR